MRLRRARASGSADAHPTSPAASDTCRGGLGTVGRIAAWGTWWAHILTEVFGKQFMPSHNAKSKREAEGQEPSQIE
jgi:hypothetical protein